MIDVTVIIPAYNKGENLHFPLKSLIAQTFSNFEVIVVDDGSTDNTSHIVKEYVEQDSRFKYVFQENAGVSMARNKGLMLATGEYICFLDADDFYANEFLEKLHRKISTTNSDVCYCGYNVITVEGNSSPKKTKFKETSFLVEYLLGTVQVITNGWMIKKCFIERHNLSFLQDVSWGEDIEFFCDVLARTDKIVAVKDYLTNYRVDFDDNQLSSFSMDKLEKDYESIQRLVNNNIVNSNPKVKKALINYRLSALLTYRLVLAIQLGESREIIVTSIKKYKKDLFRFSFMWNNTLRSIKLSIYKLRLWMYLKG